MVCLCSDRHEITLQIVGEFIDKLGDGSRRCCNRDPGSKRCRYSDFRFANRDNDNMVTVYKRNGVGVGRGWLSGHDVGF